LKVPLKLIGLQYSMELQFWAVTKNEKINLVSQRWDYFVGWVVTKKQKDLEIQSLERKLGWSHFRMTEKCLRCRSTPNEGWLGGV